MKKRLFATVLALCLLLGLLPGGAWAAEKPEISGTCGDSTHDGKNVQWFFVESEQTLALTGSGETASAFGGSWFAPPAPWRDLADKIKYIHVQGKITKLGRGIFSDCTSAVGITLPETLEAIGEGAFPYGGNAALQHFITESNKGKYFDDSGVLYERNRDGSCNLYCYPSAMKQRTYELRSDTQKIAGFGFWDNKYIEKVVLNDSLSDIRSDAFSGCTALTEINIPSGITSIQAGTFEFCYSLKDLTLPSSLSSLDISAFFGCDAIDSFTIPASVTEIKCEKKFEFNDDYSRHKDFYFRGNAPKVDDNMNWSSLHTDAGYICSNVYYPENAQGWSELAERFKNRKDVKFYPYDLLADVLPAAPAISLTTSTTIPAGTSTAVQWNAVPGAARYLLSVMTRGTYLDKDTPISECKKELQFLTPGVYEIWVKAENTKGTSAESNHIMVTVTEKPPVPTYSLSYDLNGGTGTIPPVQRMEAGSIATITEIIPTRNDYNFAGWSDGITIYHGGQSFSMPGKDLVLTAQWKKLGEQNITTAGWSSNSWYYRTKMAQNREQVEAVYNALQNTTDSETLSRIYDILFNSQYRPTVLGGSYWPYRNADSQVYSSIHDSNLNKNTSFYASKGCLSYTRFASNYIYDAQSEGSRIFIENSFPNGLAGNTPSEDELKKFITRYASPGEHIQFHYKNNQNIHSILYLTSDENGIYSLSYSEPKGGPGSIQLIFTSWKDLQASIYNVPSDIYVHTIVIYDKNKQQGKQISGTLSCPVEMSITYHGEVLSSNGLNGTTTSTFGSLTASGNPTNRRISFDIDYHDNYEISIFGNASGSASLRLEFTNMNGVAGYREYKNIPITSSTKIDISHTNINDGIYLNVDEDADGIYETGWYAGINETATSGDINVIIGSQGDPNDYDGIQSLPASPDTPNTNYISVPKTANGEVIPSTRYAAPGERVTLSIHPDDGFELASLTVTDVRGRTLTLRDLGDNRRAFTMPDNRVTVDAVFQTVDAPSTNPADDEPFTGLGTPGITGIVLNPAPMPFADVQPKDWFYDNVDYMWKHYLMSGVTDTQFSPNVTTSRAMIWTILARMNKIKANGSGNLWYEPGMLWAMEQGVTDGTSPLGDITREQLATMLWRSAGKPTPGAAADLSRFSDSSSVSDYAQTAVRWAASVGILQGNDGRIDPLGTATRAQVAAMVARYGDRIA